MAPDLGPLATKTVIIAENDGAAGTVQFTPIAATSFTVPEDVGTALVPVTRGPGNYGDVRVRYRVLDDTALGGVDYVGLQQGVNEDEVLIKDGMAGTTINVTIINDLEREYDETFLVVLTQALGKHTYHVQP